MIQAFTRHLPADYQPKVILEIGSYDGRQAIEFAQAYPMAHVYAFEASPLLVKACRARTKDCPNITVIHGAVTNHDGDVRFHHASMTFPQTRATSSLYQFKAFAAATVVVPAIRLDTWLQAQGIEKVDLIWADIQGAELLMLQGLGTAIETVDAMFLEVFYREVWYKNIPLSTEIKQFMEEHNFVLKEDIACAGSPHWGDHVYLRKE